MVTLRFFSSFVFCCAFLTSTPELKAFVVDESLVSTADQKQLAAIDAKLHRLFKNLPGLCKTQVANMMIMPLLQ